MTTFTPAVLITGYDNRQNPFAFWKSINGWVDSYNECATDIDFVRKHVFPHVQQAVIGPIVMTGAEWVEAGCPISLSDEQITAIEEATRLEAQYEKPQADEADWFTNTASERNDEYSIPLDLIERHNAKVKKDIFTRDPNCKHEKAYPTYGGMMCRCGAKFEARNEFEQSLVNARNPKGNGYVNWQFR
jgi:hypothetical protein